MIYFETERLILRGWRQEDLPRFVAMNKDERVMRYFPATLSHAETESFFSAFMMSSKGKVGDCMRSSINLPVNLLVMSGFMKLVSMLNLPRVSRLGGV